MNIRTTRRVWLMSALLATGVGMMTDAAAQDTVQPVLEVDRLRASASLQNALDGRDLAARYLCGDEGRLRRISDLDDLLTPLLTRYQQRFGVAWTGGNRLPDRTQALEQATGRRNDCEMQDSFFAGLADYQNGIYAARSVLGSGDDDYRRPRTTG